ncbi:hypothetical protein J8F10_22615 [Gemmata sp. G18]|uniref:Uncharacterized protein n=1 Tax=Gemmata palustris TaxID=2822762 RepID=A0ABS5BWD9_9BACT|nr:hypothetical protein [Gemmata palustris]MBP3958057.1 hypothetical protein [Gemmata palustris]
MQPASPSVTPPSRGAGSAALRGTFALLLAFLVAAVVGAQPAVPGRTAGEEGTGEEGTDQTAGTEVADRH